MQRRSLTFVVISVLIVALVYSSLPKTYVTFASQSSSITPIKCEVADNPAFVECCQTSKRGPGDIEIHWCTMCDNTDPPSNCGERYPSTDIGPPPPPGPGRPLGSIPEGGGVLPELQQNPQSQPQSRETAPAELAPQVDCAQNPDDPLCETATIPESSPEGLAPQVDCNENPDDLLCETATIPEDQGNDDDEDNTGEDPSSDGGNEDN